ncbi:hypothetical protein scyTo_0013787, partial [Scyliorhinus torazame]|nr:hypothetical protein [Scyliorhinus torazame]
QSVMNSLSRGKKAFGDLIPWTVSEQDPDFGSLSGGRIVRIAVHPDYQGAISLLEEMLSPRKDLPPLLLKLNERPTEKLDYLGVSYGLTSQLLKFWKRAGYAPVYLRQTPNELTGEHSCIMLKALNEEEEDVESPRENWLLAFWKDFRRRFLSLLSYQFNSFPPSVALNILQNKNMKQELKPRLNRSELETKFTPYDLKRLEMYSRNMVDYHLIMDMLPSISQLYFLNQLGDISLSVAQSALLLGVGLQHKSVDQLEKEIDLPSSQLMGLFNRLIRKVVQLFNNILEKAVEEQMITAKEIVMEPTIKSLSEDLEEAAKEFQAKHKEEVEKLKGMDLTQYMIRGNAEEWNDVLKTAGQNATIISIQGAKRKQDSVEKGSIQLQKKRMKKNKEKKQKWTK